MRNYRKMVVLAIAVFFGSSMKAQTLESFLAEKTCIQLDSVNVEEAKTPKEKKDIILMAFAKAVANNQPTILKSPEFKTLNSYDQGRRMGRLYSEKVVPLLIQTCPRFRKLLDNK